MSIRQYTRARSAKSALRSLSNEHLHQLLSISKEDPRLQELHDVVMIVSSTGLRSGELRNLRWIDIDDQKHRFKIGGGMSYGSRWVPLGPNCLQLLKDRFERGPESEHVLGEYPKETLLRVSRQLSIACNGFGIGGVTLRVIRNGFFLRMLMAGCDVQALMEIGGYRSPRLALKCLLNQDQLVELASRHLSRLEEHQ
jgi:integrase